MWARFGLGLFMRARPAGRSLMYPNLFFGKFLELPKCQIRKKGRKNANNMQPKITQFFKFHGIFINKLLLGHLWGQKKYSAPKQKSPRKMMTKKKSGKFSCALFWNFAYNCLIFVSGENAEKAKCKKMPNEIFQCFLNNAKFVKSDIGTCRLAALSWKYRTGERDWARAPYWPANSLWCMAVSDEAQQIKEYSMFYFLFLLLLLALLWFLINFTLW